MTRLFLDEIIQSIKTLQLTGEKARYLSTVLRYGPGDSIIVTDTTNSSFTARIISISKKQSTIEITGSLHQNSESPLDIVLLQGILKGAKMDLVVQKATELGVTEIVPVITDRSQIRETRKHQRWQKIAEEASRQCGRNRIPLILETVAFESVIASEGYDKGILFWEEEKIPVSNAVSELKGLQRIVLCIGPEGGFSEKEVSTAHDRGYLIASLGKRILRAETAAVAAIVIVQYVLGDISHSL